VTFSEVCLLLVALAHMRSD